MLRSKGVSGPMEVRVTPHSSLSSWDERGPKQTKAKADGEGWRVRREEKRQRGERKKNDKEK